MATGECDDPQGGPGTTTKRLALPLIPEPRHNLTLPAGRDSAIVPERREDIVMTDILRPRFEVLGRPAMTASKIYKRVADTMR